jgi:N5-(cytidine 5'-diphosphoramidyl)-L-glutamine hydrolase
VNSLKIGISMRIIKAQNYDEERDALSHDWSTFSQLTGITLIPILNSDNVLSFLEKMNLDGVILSGGDSIGVTPKRDKIELEIINYCINKKLPIFGVCRGMQILNSFFHGNMTNDLTNLHVKQTHQVKITNNILELFNDKQYSVNSYHNNLIHEQSLGDNLKIFAMSEFDNTVEGFFHESLPIIGVMWHPERTPDEFNQNLVNTFFKSRLG